MNRDVCEHFNPVDLPCEKCKSASVQKSTLREAAQQALDVLENAYMVNFWAWVDQKKQAVAALRAALAEPVQEPVAWLFTNLQSGDYDFCYQEDEHDHDREMWHKQPLYTAPPQQPLTIERLRDALGTKCMAEPHTGVTLKPVLYENRRLTNEEVDAIVGKPNAEPYDQTSLELCEVCGWKTLIPGDCCLNCERINPCSNCASLQDQNTELDRKLRAAEEIVSSPHIVTHAEGCWSWGPRHYLCAYREIQRLQRELEDGTKA